MGGKIEIRRWDVLDIFYHTEDIKRVNELIKEYKSKGWTLEAHRDNAGNEPYTESSQMMKLHKIKTKKLKP